MPTDSILAKSLKFIKRRPQKLTARLGLPKATGLGSLKQSLKENEAPDPLPERVNPGLDMTAYGKVHIPISKKKSVIRKNINFEGGGSG